MCDVLIVGGGPAGLTAGLYAARAGRKAMLFEKSVIGGQAAMTSRIENYPGYPNGIDGPELCMAMEEQAVSAGVRVVYENVREIECSRRRVRTDSGWYQAKQLILAMGAQPKRIGAEGESLFVGRGISFCATCDGAFYRGKRVAVIGGGNSAAEEALYLAGIGCDVLLIHRRDTLRAENALAKQVLSHPGIRVLWNSWVEAFEGAQKLERIRLNQGRVERMDGAFIAVGRIPDTALVEGQLGMDAQGFILAGEDCRTSVPGVFAAGDLRAKRLRQVVTAVSDGAIAASQIERE